MKVILLLLAALVCWPVVAEERVLYRNVIECTQFPKLQKTDYLFSKSDIKHPEEMRRVIPALMRLDLNQKIEAISLVLPKDWKEAEGIPYELQLSEYNRSLFSRQASCLVEYYKEGDRLYRFEQPPEGSYDEGYALFRNETLIAIVITGGIII